MVMESRSRKRTAQAATGPPVTAAGYKRKGFRRTRQGPAPQGAGEKRWYSESARLSPF